MKLVIEYEFDEKAGTATRRVLWPWGSSTEETLKFPVEETGVSGFVNYCWGYSGTPWRDSDKVSRCVE